MALLRVVSWNLHGLRDDRAAVVRALRALDGDVVCLQEVPLLPMMPGSRIRLAGLARRTGLHLVGGGRSAAGDALLVSPRVQVDEFEELRLPTSRWRWSDRRVAGVPVPVPEPRIGEQRGAVVATVRLPGGPPLVVACVHLSLDPVERLRHAGMIVEVVRRRRLPAVIAGDLNERPGGPAWTALGELVADPVPDAGPTYSAQDLRYRIDAVLTSPSLTVVSYGDGGVDPADARVASDHWPVVADLRSA
jgi:endonuclease/exonuclease/phosphatase family metal-dependent hydrolase